ncbi:MAG: excinuclease ABC subunit UvrB [Syntrophales bacterium]|jgi:excinuclease ABC subunit B|nr:excinuclease ABC subunit UvrB [Syntrophales bacterium]MCK9527798.1 excinuclease ABC subunit UvrB [Syntrophales bacterium]MDX9922105.1 excinuclease ABC subunit UvrB [Syntrophales bacterium]
MDLFKLTTDFLPRGDQKTAIEELARGAASHVPCQVLLGVTGSGKTFTIANVIEKMNRPTLVIAHNKTLAAQLYGEFKGFFPENAVEYFVSYYDYYQPEAYLPGTDTYIEKDASINDEIDKLRHSATRSLLDRRDVIIVASVSCIYGIGSPESYSGMRAFLSEGDDVDRDLLITRLVELHYDRNDTDFHRGTFRVRGDTVELFPPYAEDRVIRLEFFGDTLETIAIADPLRGQILERRRTVTIHPGSHYVLPAEDLKRAIETISDELVERLEELRSLDKPLEARRLEQRTRFDLEMLEEMGYCQGIENYSRHLTGRAPGEPPPTLMEYLPDDALIVIDESHQTIPQLRGMYRGDRSRKQTLVEYGFRLPSALDNRPLTFEEFEAFPRQWICVSATPAAYELERAGGYVVEQIIRPTGLMDPEIVVKPAARQVDDLLEEINVRVDAGERVLITTLTKRMAEHLTDYYRGLGVKVAYLHSDVKTLERVALIRDLRRGVHDVLVGVNLLREGLDIPEVSLVAILDADKEGFLRSEQSLIQTSGRAARNVNGRVIMYADQITLSIQKCLDETKRRRSIQKKYNGKMGITPETITKSISDILTSVYEADYVTVPVTGDEDEPFSEEEILASIDALTKGMKEASAKLEFERAAVLRDRIRKLKGLQTELGVWEWGDSRGRRS